MIFTIALLSAFSCKLTASEVEKITAYLSKVNLMDPAKDVKAAMQAKDYRPMAVHGYSEMTPGLELRHLRSMPDKGKKRKVIHGTSDFIWDSQHDYLIDIAHRYAARYNEVLFEQLKAEDKLRITYPTDDDLRYVVLPEFIITSDLKGVLQHLHDQLLKHHPASKVPVFKIAQGVDDSVKVGFALDRETDVMTILEYTSESTDVDFFIETNVVTFGIEAAKEMTDKKD